MQEKKMRVDILFKTFHISVLVHSLRFKGIVWIPLGEN